MDYDATQMPGNYDKGRSLSPEALAGWFDLVESRLAGQRLSNILDLGCGTGRFSEALAAHFDAEVLGVDPSLKMLEEARKKPRSGRVSYANGRGESLPLPDRCVDMVFMSMVFHHLESPERTAHECLRVLRMPGVVCVRSPTSERISDYAYVPFFPTTVPIIRERIASGTAIQAVFEKAGFSLLYAGALVQKIAENWQDYLEKLEYRADSILISITDADFEAGLARVRSHAQDADPREPVTEPIDAFIKSAGRKPRPSGRGGRPSAQCLDVAFHSLERGSSTRHRAVAGRPEVFAPEFASYFGKIGSSKAPGAHAFE